MTHYVKTPAGALEFRLDGPLVIVRQPNSSHCVEKKSRLDRQADGILFAAGYDTRARRRPSVPLTVTRGVRGAGRKLRAAWPQVLELRGAGLSVAAIARRLGFKAHTLARHLTLERPMHSIAA